MDKVRLAATKILHDTAAHGAWANVALAQTLRQEKFSDLDRKFCTELVYGIVKAGASLDWKIAKYISRQSRRVHCIFSGSSPYSETAQKILEQMIFFLEEDLNLEHKPLDDAEEVYSQLQLRLKELSEHVEPSQPVHFVIDAVDMLATDRHKEFLDFLPITGNVRCLVSGADNFDFKAAHAHTSTRLETLNFLVETEVSAVLEKILAQRGKQLFPNVAAAVQEKIGRTLPPPCKKKSAERRRCIWKWLRRLSA